MINNHYDPPKYPLSEKAILSAIDVACQKNSLPHLIWKRCCHPDDSPSTLLSYRFVGEVKSAVSSSKNIEEEHSSIAPAATTVPVVQLVVVVVASFYLAYSTWDGRILYVDHIDTMMDDTNAIARSDTTEKRPTLLLAVYQILAHIAILLDCTRLTWQHTKKDAIVFPKSCQPETLHGWLTLHWERESIIRFLGIQPPDTCTTQTTPSSDRTLWFREIIERTIQRCNATTTTASMGSRPNIIRRLRLAGPTDIPSISRLVQGLADYEKEPDAVHVTPDHYQMDGFQSDPPLFYCLLLEEAGTTTAVDNIAKTNTVDDWYACGMAFCWMGARQDVPQHRSHSEEVEEGTLVTVPSPEMLFLYLEDLFIEEAYRGNGAGTFVMTTLGEIAVSLHCQKMVWQALDWNTPALTFYQNKIRARVVDGLWTTRFAGSALYEFHVQESEGDIGHDQGPN